MYEDNYIFGIYKHILPPPPTTTTMHRIMLFEWKLIIMNFLHSFNWGERGEEERRRWRRGGKEKVEEGRKEKGWKEGGRKEKSEREGERERKR